MYGIWVLPHRFLDLFNQVASEEVEISIKEMLGAIATFQEKLKVNNDS